MVAEARWAPYELRAPTLMYSLSLRGPQSQRDLGRNLHLERATLSGVVATLVRKGLIRQTPDPSDQRQRRIELTAEGAALWDRLPDPFEQVRAVALEGISAADLETATRVLQAAVAHVEQGPFRVD